MCPFFITRIITKKIDREPIVHGLPSIVYDLNQSSFPVTMAIFNSPIALVI
jgi:hypothetical protein